MSTRIEELSEDGHIAMRVDWEPKTRTYVATAEGLPFEVRASTRPEAEAQLVQAIRGYREGFKAVRDDRISELEQRVKALEERRAPKVVERPPLVIEDHPMTDKAARVFVRGFACFVIVATAFHFVGILSGPALVGCALGAFAGSLVVELILPGRDLIVDWIMGKTQS